MSIKIIALGVLSMIAMGFCPAALAQTAQKLYFIEGDIVRGNTPDGATGPVCVLANLFMRKENVIFRIRVSDTAVRPLDEAKLKSVVVELGDGQKLAARFAPRPPQAVIAAMNLPGPTDHYWTAAWRIAENYPTGTLTYKVTVTDREGNLQEWRTFNDPRSLPIVVEGQAQFSKPAAR